MLPLVILTYEDFDRAWHREHDSGLVYVINILGQDAGLL
jgi:hypothetical protein